MTHILENKKDLDDTDERAKKAIQAFRTLQPTLTAFAKVLTKRNDVRVEMAAQSNGSTDGKRIFFRPPIGLGDKTEHVRTLCGKRDEHKQHLCAACKVRESVLVPIYHEIAHICLDTMAQPTEEDKVKLLDDAIKMVDSRYAEAVRARIQTASGYQRRSYLSLAGAVSKFLPIILNGLEDARVNQAHFKARPGTKVMFDAETWRIFDEGVEAKNPVTGEITHQRWQDREQNMQFIIGLFCKASGYDYSDWFISPVIEALNDEEISRLVVKVPTARSVRTVYELCFPILARAKELGFCQEETDPQSEPEEEPEDGKDSSDSGDDPEEGSESGSDDKDKSDSDTDTDGDKRNREPDSTSWDEKGNSDESDPSAASDSDEYGTGYSDESSDESDSEESDGEVDADSNEQEDNDNTENNDNTDEESSDAESENSSSDSSGESGHKEDVDEDAERSPEDSDEAAGGMEEDSGRDDDGGTGDLDMGAGSSLPGGEGESDGPAGSDSMLGEDDSLVPPDGPADDVPDRDGPGPSGLDESEGDSEGFDDKPDLSGDDLGSVPMEASDSSPMEQRDDDGSLESTEESDDTEVPGKDALGEESTKSLDPIEDDGTPIDTGADEGRGGVEVLKKEEYDHIPMGDADDCEIGLLKWEGHDDPPPSIEGKIAEEKIERAILQGLYFETPSAFITGVREHYFGQPIYVDGINMSRGWQTGVWGRLSDDTIGRGGEEKYHTPESILGAVLLKMRVAFSDNMRSSYQRHLKKGRVDARVLGKRAWNGKDERLFQRKFLPGKKDYFVLLGIDISGSTVGENIEIAKRVAFAQATLLQRMGIAFAIYAHTGNLHQPSRGRSGGLNMDIYHIKDADEPWDSKVQHRLIDLGPDAANLDGHTIEFYRKVCDTRPESHKIILYYSDGKMPAENHDEELEILQREIKVCRQKGYTLLGVGIRTDSPARHGLETIQVEGISDLAKVADQLGKHIAVA